MGWLNIAGIGNNRIVRSMTMWLFLTPILAKSLAPINSMRLDFLGIDRPLTISLPFSWEIFFFSAFSFAVANVIYSVKSPLLIRCYGNYADFESKENSLYFLVESFKRPLMAHNNYQPDLALKETVARYTPDNEISSAWQENQIDNWKKGVDSLKHSSRENLPDIFASFRMVLSTIHPCWFTACLIFYLVGFLGIAWVAAENFVFVYNQL